MVWSVFEVIWSVDLRAIALPAPAPQENATRIHFKDPLFAGGNYIFCHPDVRSTDIALSRGQMSVRRSDKATVEYTPSTPQGANLPSVVRLQVYNVDEVCLVG